MTIESLFAYIGFMVMFCLIIAMVTMAVTHMFMDKESMERIKGWNKKVDRRKNNVKLTEKGRAK